MKREELLAEIEDAIATAPPYNGAEVVTWMRRAGAAIELWDETLGLNVQYVLTELAPNRFAPLVYPGYRQFMVLLQRACRDLQVTAGKLPAPVTITDIVIDYLDEVRDKIRQARQDVLFVDPHMNAQFVAKCLPAIASGVTTRLLTSERTLATLLPAADALVSQSNAHVEVRSSSELFDRLVFVDLDTCYQTGILCKDGTEISPTELTKITDAFEVVRDDYQDIWNRAKVER